MGGRVAVESGIEAFKLSRQLIFIFPDKKQQQNPSKTMARGVSGETSLFTATKDTKWKRLMCYLGQSLQFQSCGFGRIVPDFPSTLTTSLCLFAARKPQSELFKPFLKI